MGINVISNGTTSALYLIDQSIAASALMLYGSIGAISVALIALMGIGYIFYALFKVLGKKF